MTRILPARNCLLALIACLLQTVPRIGMAQEETLDRIVAVVGKEAIFLSDLEAQTEFYAVSNRIDPNSPGLREQVLDAMINEKLVLAQALRDTSISATEEEVTARLDELIQQRINHPQIGSQQKLEELYGMPVSRMKREFRDEMRKQVLVQKLQQNRFGDVQVSRREVEEFYEKYRDSLPRVPEQLDIYDIFRYPRVSSSMKERIMSRARSVLDSIRAGGDFADFAMRYSDDKATAEAGGDLGTWRRGEFVPDFEEIVFSLKENEVSDIVETSRGFHIVQLLERRGDRVHARHILFKASVDSVSASEAVAYLDALRDSALQGVPFTDLARRHSDDKESGPLGGMLGRLPADQFDPALLRVVDSLKPGEISKPVELLTGTVRGYHIVWLKDRTPAHDMNTDQDWARLEELALGFKRNLEYEKWIAELRTQLYWEVRL